MSDNRRRKTIIKWKYDALLVMAITLTLSLGMGIVKYNFLDKNVVLLSPLPKENNETIITITKTKVETITKEVENIDTWVDKYSEKYTDTNTQKSIIKAKIHFLLSAESKHCEDNNHGDSGKAGGCLQFWNATWNRMRNEMKEEGLIEDINTRYDVEAAIETTAWAISKGYEKEWGPILRGEIKL